jgi:hypothetical protein
MGEPCDLRHSDVSGDVRSLALAVREIWERIAVREAPADHPRPTGPLVLIDPRTVRGHECGRDPRPVRRASRSAPLGGIADRPAVGRSVSTVFMAALPTGPQGQRQPGPRPSSADSGVVVRRFGVFAHRGISFIAVR